MFKVASATAVAVGLLSSTAMGQVLTKGQFYATQQYTGLFDPGGICGQLGLAAGQVSTAVATIGGLGLAYSSEILTTTGTGTTSNPYGVGVIACSFPALPAKTAFTKNADGSYTAMPTGNQVTTCVSSKGTFTLTSSNGTDPNTGLPQTLVLTILANPTGSKDSGLRQTATNSALGGGGAPYLCSLSTDVVYLNTVK